jgi:hypothetical protein
MKKLMVILILVICIIYNPHLEQFKLFISSKVSDKIIIDNNYVDNAKVSNHSDWIIFTIYTVEFSSTKSHIDNTQTQLKKISLPSQYYMGALKNFWNITRVSEEEIDERVASGDTWVHRLFN